jgi:hypothetical protein
MKKKGLYVLIAAIFMAFSFDACEEDLLNNDIRDQLEGKWSVTEDNNLKSTDYYNVTISKSLSDTSKILINNFYAINATVEAEISDLNLSIPQQTVSGFTFHGYGTVSGNMKKIEWSYTVDHNNGFIDQVTATYNKN